jgi:hypothetical protein
MAESPRQSESDPVAGSRGQAQTWKRARGIDLTVQSRGWTDNAAYAGAVTDARSVVKRLAPLPAG